MKFCRTSDRNLPSVFKQITCWRELTTDNAVGEAVAFAKAFLSSAAAKGENPEVFFYKFAKGPQTAVMLLCFYGGTEFLVQFDER